MRSDPSRLVAETASATGTAPTLPNRPPGVKSRPGHPRGPPPTPCARRTTRADQTFPDEAARSRTLDDASTRFATYARRAGLPHIGGTHGLRRTLASALEADGLATISALLGHASTTATSTVSTHMFKGADRAAVYLRAATLLGDPARQGSTGAAVPSSTAEEPRWGNVQTQRTLGRGKTRR